MNPAHHISYFVHVSACMHDGAIKKSARKQLVTSRDLSMMAP